MLMSEDRSDRLKSEQQRLKEYIKEVERLIRLEKSLQGQTESGTNLKKLAEEQARIAAQTGDLSQKIRETEEPNEGQEGADQNKEGENKDESAKWPARRARPKKRIRRKQTGRSKETQRRPER